MMDQKVFNKLIFRLWLNPRTILLTIDEKGEFAKQNIEVSEKTKLFSLLCNRQHLIAWSRIKLKIEIKISWSAVQKVCS